jgi:hypothetical protein
VIRAGLLNLKDLQPYSSRDQRPPGVLVHHPTLCPRGHGECKSRQWCPHPPIAEAASELRSALGIAPARQPCYDWGSASPHRKQALGVYTDFSHVFSQGDAGQEKYIFRAQHKNIKLAKSGMRPFCVEQKGVPAYLPLLSLPDHIGTQSRLSLAKKERVVGLQERSLQWLDPTRDKAVEHSIKPRRRSTRRRCETGGPRYATKHTLLHSVFSIP